MKSLFITLLLLTAMAFASCSGKKQETAEDSASSRTENVRVTPLETREVSRTIEYTGTLLPWEEVHIAPAQPGRIMQIPVEVGTRVSAGTLLVQMDPTQLLQAQLQLSNLETDFQRLDTLRKSGSIAQQQFDQLKTQYEITKTNVEFLRNNTRLTAPFSGIISGKYHEPGEMFSGAPNPMTGKAAVVSLVQIDRLKITVAVSEQYFPRIRNGMTAIVITDIYPDREFNGTIFRIHPTIDPMSRSFNVEVMISNTGNLLRPGMFSRVSLDLDKIEALLLPAAAVLKMQGSNDRFLFKEENGKAVRVPVTTGRRYDDLIEVFSDKLKKGDRIITSGQARLIDGVNVNVVQ
jgi:membrane fusion protein, multidrug efflux system